MIPYFLIDEELGDLQSSLKELITEIKYPQLQNKVQVLKKFVLAATSTFVRKPITLITPEKKIKVIPPIKKIPEDVEKLQPQDSLQMQLVQVPVGYEVYPIPEPGKDLQAYTVKPIIHKKLIHPHAEYVILIKDYMTNQVLASAEINEFYKVNEPVLTEFDLEVYNKVISKQPKDMREGWTLIEYYAKKYNTPNLTNIKYYVANKLFALGKLEPLLQDDHISTISCSGATDFIKVTYNGRKLDTNLMFETKEELDDFLFAIAKRTNNKLDKDNPILDAELRGFRVHCVLGVETSSKFTFTRI